MSQGQRFVVTVEGIDHTVIVEPTGDATPVRATVGDRVFELVAGPDGVVLARPVGGHGHVRVHLDGSARPAQAHACGRVLALRTRSAREAALEAARAAASGGADDGGSIRAPMPGRVVRVLVAVGEEVAADAPLIIVEAMKMENEVRSVAAGRVEKIAVSAAETVEAGQLLCELQPLG